MSENVNEILGVKSNGPVKQEDLHSTKSVTVSLMDGEEVLLNVNNKQLILTTHRIRQESYGTTGALLGMTSIMLEEICSCSLKAKRNIIILIIGIIIGGALIFKGSTSYRGEGINTVGVLLFVGFLFLYLYLQKKIISFRSGGDAIEVTLSEISIEETKKIIDKVEMAKNNRYQFAK